MPAAIDIAPVTPHSERPYFTPDSGHPAPMDSSVIRPYNLARRFPWKISFYQMSSPFWISRYKRWAYLGIGWFFFGLGLVGAFLPILPTTPLMIIALWAFSKSSDRFQHWLYNHSVFGPPIQRWHKFRVISAAAKIAAIGSMAASITYLVIFTTISLPVLLITGGVMLAGAWYILSKPSEAPAETPNRS